MSRTAALRQRWSSLPVLARDGVLAAALTIAGQVELVLAAGEVEGPRVLQHLAFAVMTGALAGRRVRPLAAAAVGGAGLAGQTLLGSAPVASGFVALIVLVYSVATYAATRRRAVLGLLAVVAGVLVYPFVEDVVFVDEVVNALIPTVLWVLARVARERLDRAVAAERRRQQEAQEQQRRQDEALAGERRRIARELHDTVAHGVTLMLLQAEIVRGADDVGPDSRQALEVAQSAGRACLDDLRRLLVLLREESPEDAAPGLHGVELLADAARAAGVDVQVSPPPSPPVLPASLDVAAYRVVQEALTNAARYAPGATVTVRWELTEEGLVLDVVDDGARVRGVPQQGTGHGLLGARERVALHEGTLDAGPRSDGSGWQVHAVLPHPDSAQSHPAPA
jgi:signal transduction histidine kinase